MQSGTYVCANPECAKVIENDASATLWMNTPLGLTTLRACRNQECVRAAAVSKTDEGWKLRRGNLPPFKNPEERAAYVKARDEAAA